MDRKIKSRQYYIFISHRLLQIFTTLIRFSSTGLDAQQTSINKVFLDLFINEKLKIIPWLKRYAYLILLNSRVRLELSGLFVNQDQCNQAFDQLRLTFCSFIATLSELYFTQCFKCQYNPSHEDMSIALDKVEVPEMANLFQENCPLGGDNEFELQQNLNQLPINLLLKG